MAMPLSISLARRAPSWKGSGKRLTAPLAAGFQLLERTFGIEPRTDRPTCAPTGGAIDISLSFRMTNSRFFRWPALFIASYAMPALIAPSPITAIASPGSPPRSAPAAKPSAALIEVDDYAPRRTDRRELSDRLVKPDSPPFWRKGADAVAPPGQDLVRIALVAHVPDELVARAVEHGMQGHCQFDDAQPCPQMAAGDRHGAEIVSARSSSASVDRSRSLRPFRSGRHAHAVKDRGMGTVGHGSLSFHAG